MKIHTLHNSEGLIVLKVKHDFYLEVLTEDYESRNSQPTGLKLIFCSERSCGAASSEPEEGRPAYKGRVSNIN